MNIIVSEEEAFLIMPILIAQIEDLQQQPVNRCTEKSIEILQQFLRKLTPVADREQTQASLN